MPKNVLLTADSCSVVVAISVVFLDISEIKVSNTSRYVVLSHLTSHS